MAIGEGAHPSSEPGNAIVQFKHKAAEEMSQHSSMQNCISMDPSVDISLTRRLIQPPRFIAPGISATSEILPCPDPSGVVRTTAAPSGWDSEGELSSGGQAAKGAELMIVSAANQVADSTVGHEDLDGGIAIDSVDCRQEPLMNDGQQGE